MPVLGGAAVSCQLLALRLVWLVWMVLLPLGAVAGMAAVPIGLPVLYS